MKKLLIVSVIFFSVPLSAVSGLGEECRSKEGSKIKREEFLRTAQAVFQACSDYHKLGFARTDKRYIMDKSMASCITYNMHQRLGYLLGRSTPGVKTPSSFKYEKTDFPNINAGRDAVIKWMDSPDARDIAMSKLEDHIEECSGVRPELRTTEDIKLAYSRLWLDAFQEFHLSHLNGIGLIKKKD